MNKEIPQHPDPEWWKRSPLAPAAGVKRREVDDLCDNCGHVRTLHSLNGQCHSPSVSLFDSRSCFCLSGKVYRMPQAVIVSR